MNKMRLLFAIYNLKTTSLFVQLYKGFLVVGHVICAIIVYQAWNIRSVNHSKTCCNKKSCSSYSSMVSFASSTNLHFKICSTCPKSLHVLSL